MARDNVAVVFLGQLGRHPCRYRAGVFRVFDLKLHAVADQNRVVIVGDGDVGRVDEHFHGVAQLQQVARDARQAHLVVASAIDNLVKRAGQRVDDLPRRANLVLCLDALLSAPLAESGKVHQVAADDARIASKAQRGAYHPVDPLSVVKRRV